ncbi:hypothetical protein JCM17960_16100 [Magnetospira thiophila]
MITYDVTPDLLDRAAALFGDRAAADDLLTTTRRAALPSPARLSAYAQGSLSWPQPDLEQALGRHLPLRRAFRAMVQAAATHHVPRARAASSEALPTREGTDCRLSLRESRAEPDQLYLVVEISGTPPEGPTTLVICDSADNMTQIALPTPRKGVVQVILDRQSDAVRMLADPQTEAYLR